MDRVATMGTGFFAGAIPFFCALLGAVIANFPLSFSGGELPPPLLAWMPIYFWALVRPDLMPPASVFVLGLTQDLLSGGPPGISAASFLLAYAVVDRQRDSFASLSSWAAILGFALSALIVSGCAFLLASAFFWKFPNIVPVLACWSLTVLFYIPAVFAMGALHHRLVGSRRTHL